MDVAKLNEAVREEALAVQAAVDEVRKVIVGQRTLVDRMMVALLCRGHLLVEGVPGLAKTLAVKTLGQVLDLALRADPVHARPAAGRPRRHARLPAEERRVRGAQGPGLHQPAARRRDQPRPRQGAVGAARGDAGAAGDARRRDPPAARPVPGVRDAEPDRAGGHLPAARGAGRPLPAEGARRLPDAVGGAPDPRPHDLGRGAVRLQGALRRRGAPARAAACATSTSTSGSATTWWRSSPPRGTRAASASSDLGAADRVRRLAARDARVLARPRAPSPSCAAAATSSPRT